MRSPFGVIGVKSRSPFGAEAYSYRPVVKRRAQRGILITAALMLAATAATGAYIRHRLHEGANPAAVEASLTLPEPKVVQTRKITLAPKGQAQPASDASQAPAAEGAQPKSLSGSDPRWAETAAVPAQAEPQVAEAAADPDAADGGEDAAPAPQPADRTARKISTSDDAAARKAPAAKTTEKTRSYEGLPGVQPLALAAEPRGKEVTAAIDPDSSSPAADDEFAAPKATSVPPAEGGRSARIVHAVNMRVSPRSGSKVIRIIPNGATVALGGCNGWCQVTYQGSTGYIYKSFLGGVSAAPRPRKAAAAPKPSAKAGTASVAQSPRL